MLPATTVARPAARHSAPVSAVTVDLPFEPGDREHFLLRRQRAREELDVADELRAVRDCGGDRRLILGDSRADRDEIGAGERRGGGRAGGDRNGRQRAASFAANGGDRPRVGDPHVRALRGEMAREREPGEPESQHDGVASGRRLGVHRSFSVERPNSTSSIVMIQKRTTTWFSFQPLSS